MSRRHLTDAPSATAPTATAVSIISATGDLDEATALRMLHWCEVQLHLLDIGQGAIGHLVLDIQDGRIVDHKEGLIWLWADGEMNPEPEIIRLVKDVEESIGSDYGEIIGESKRDHLCKAPGIESTLGNWIADVMVWKTGAKIAFHNSGGIRADILRGPISKADVFAVSPFFNTLVMFDLTGQQIKDLLEFDIDKGRDRLQVSGIRYSYFSRKDRKYGQRVHRVEVNGEVIVRDGIVLEADRVFQAVSNNYLIGHADTKYFGFHVEDIRRTGESLDSVLIGWLRKNRVLDYEVEGRIKLVRLNH